MTVNFFKSGQERLKGYLLRREEQRVTGLTLAGLLGPDIGDRWVARSSERNRLMTQRRVGAVARMLHDIELRATYDGADAVYRIGFIPVWRHDQRLLTGYDQVEVITYKDQVVVAFDRSTPRVVYSAKIGDFGAKVLIDRRDEYAPVIPDVADRVN